MLVRILAAVDGSDASRHALDQAIELARQLSATLRIVHVVDMNWLPLAPELAIDVEAITAARRGAGEETLKAARERARQAGLEAEAALIETETPLRRVAEAIIEEASRWTAGLVVLGTHGRRGFERMMLGSVAEGVARRSAIPVVLVPAPRRTEAAAT
jgi:nucleotide-binding universal stress UspA family protein